MNVVRKTCIVLFTLLSVVYCYAQEGELYDKKPRFTYDFVKALNSGQYLLAAMQIDRYDFYYQRDSLDYAIDFDKFDELIQYVEQHNLVSNDAYYRMHKYIAQADLAIGIDAYEMREWESANVLFYDAINLYSQLDSKYHEEDYLNALIYAGCVHCAQKDTLTARKLFEQATSVAKDENIRGELYLEAMFWLASSTSSPCESAIIWDSCYSDFLYADSLNLIRDDFVLQDTDFLSHAVISYLECGTSHMLMNDFDVAETAYVRAKALATILKSKVKICKYPPEEIDSFLLSARRNRIQLEHFTQNQFRSIFDGDGCFEGMTIENKFGHWIVQAEHYARLSNHPMAVKAFYNAHCIKDSVADIDINIWQMYYNLCINIIKTPEICSFLSNEDIDETFSFYKEKYGETNENYIAQEFGYICSLLSHYNSQALAELNRMEKKLKRLKDSISSESLRVFMNMCSLIYAECAFKKLTSGNYVPTDSIKPIYEKCYKAWEGIELWSNDDENFDESRYVFNSILIKLADMAFEHKDVERLALQYYKWKIPYVKTRINLMPEDERDLWLTTDNLDSDEAIINSMIILDMQNSLSQGLINSSYDNLLYKRGLLLRSSVSIRQCISQGEDITARHIYDEWIREKKIYADNVNESVVDKESLRVNILEKERVLMEISSQYRDSTILNNFVSWKDIKRNLGKNEVAIEFVKVNHTNSYGAFVLRKNFKEPKWVSANNYGSPQNLYDWLWKPLEKYINKGDVVYYAPDGILHEYPAQALIANDSTYLFDRYNVVMLSSTSQLIKRTEKPSTNKNVAVFGGAQYDLSLQTIKENVRLESSLRESEYANGSTDRGTMKYLPYTQKEAMFISSACDSVKRPVSLYTGAAASEDNIKSIAEDSIAILHVATHGFYWKDSLSQQKPIMSRTGLLLAGANVALSGKSSLLPNGAEDGILTSREVASLDMSSVDFVVLSACNTGLGEQTADGIYGLQRGFKMAGVHSILMSLWSVDDAATYILMTQFYKNYLGGKSKSQSLREAQRYLRNYEQDGEKIFADPKYWAAFVLLDALD